ncbi:hypothetical protein [Novilysobacter defluvii]|uniref:Adhesin n=1 Tax=Lysobacter defluvii IMMIB APB-9 = DSM 18482 TaxID=1385515 RepID=A0A0A0M6J0_9GAMM|nr:hypothetical protein [Lysobacter defluvii]KGO98613.1 adhesin [Lysobacter defluvii IMMIB APB-9 = DSM 18482]
MKVTLKKTAMALAVATLAASPVAFAQSVDDQNADADIDHQHRVNEDWDINVQDIRNYETTVVDNRDYDVTVDDTRNFETNVINRDIDVVDADITVDDTRNFETNVINRNYAENVTVDADVDADVDLVLDAAAVIRYNGQFNETVNDREDSWTTSEDHSYTSDIATTESHSYSSTWDVTANEDVDIDSDIRREQNEHGRSVYLSKDLSLDSDIDINGDIELTGDIDVDSAAIAVVDGRQTTAGNTGNNSLLDNDAQIADDAAGGASGNLGFNVAAGDNNSQDNAAALSAADASFAFGMADAEIFNSQVGANNLTNNSGVTNDANVGGAAFNGASGNISVNVASGNNNAQRNSLAASVATSAYAQASVASDQTSGGNVTNNAGRFETQVGTLQFSLTGGISGVDGSQATYEETGMSYQHANLYPELWGADTNGGDHNSSPRLGHADWDGDIQGATLNPTREGELDEFGMPHGGIAFDNVNEGVIDLSEAELEASLSGTAQYAYQVAVMATNNASLDGSAFNGASGNIGVNIASGSGNLQSNSLSLAVAQPSTGGGNGGGNGGG